MDMADRSETSSAASRDAVLQTLGSMSAEALSLLARRSEINRRIRDIHQVLYGLDQLLTKAEQSPSFAASPEPRPRDHIANWPPSQSSSLRKRVAAFRRRPGQPCASKRVFARMQRACRIALMEAGGTASLDEIRDLMIRRGSLAFVESGSSDSAILQTLIRMRVSGEVRCLDNHSRPVWERTTPSEEVGLSS